MIGVYPLSWGHQVAGLGEVPMHVGVDASLSRIHRSPFIGYPRMPASGESSTTIHRLLHASGSHPIPPPNDPKTNQYNQDLGLIHSTNANHLESPNEGSSIDHQVTIYLHAQNITMFPTNEAWEHCDVQSMQIDSDLVIYRTTLVRTFQVASHFDPFADSLGVIRRQDWVRPRCMWESMHRCRGFTARRHAWISYAI
ncbi:zinc finger protein CONSTANS-LIKE 13-like [Dorcoceras hygrometricum]|uniref:Zinc finger protein CONSTANS-LIKE 13-like n=1 Tax=Dorcoceras hygrometricum TaxID=472368 RepID=A0A2Z7BCY6_9LAMI|nr:zinc finger protein CONSTANS-LIKE 13-like [Dorcoceras hygrometricum]